MIQHETKLQEEIKFVKYHRYANDVECVCKRCFEQFTKLQYFVHTLTHKHTFYSTHAQVRLNMNKWTLLQHKPV